MTLLYTRMKTSLYEDMNKERRVLADWFRANKLYLNIFKTKCMLFCRSPPPENEILILTMANTIIQIIWIVYNF